MRQNIFPVSGTIREKNAVPVFSRLPGQSVGLGGSRTCPSAMRRLWKFFPHFVFCGFGEEAPAQRSVDCFDCRKSLVVRAIYDM